MAAILNVKYSCIMVTWDRFLIWHDIFEFTSLHYDNYIFKNTKVKKVFHLH